MELSEALNLIKLNLNENVIESKHFGEQCDDRNLDKVK